MSNITIPELEVLVKSGTIASYTLEVYDMDGKLLTMPSRGKGSREIDKLTLFFPSGETLVISTFCSGVSENTNLFFGEPVDVPNFYC